ncbi:MAG TPA: hypothetical protein VFQ65_21285 [Kofleriaceae bacterium]|nr:hypothetical protein [Kofleriaceae bacterium]
MNRLTWAEITQRYPCDWLLLLETEVDVDGRIGYACVLDHDRSVIALLDRHDDVPDTTLIHTAGRTLCVTPAFSSRNPRSERVAKTSRSAW